MFASFVGSPASGKTTTAALTFASFKELGLACEWIPEKARVIIASIRAARELDPNAPLRLSDNDTLRIMKEQWEIERVMFEATGNQVFLLADGSTLNSLLYLTPDTLVKSYVQACALDAAKKYDVIFYCPPVRQQAILDPNRVHTFEESKTIDLKIREILRSFEGKIKAPVIALIGSPTARARKVKQYLMQGGR